MSLDLESAASRLLDAGYTKDEVIQVINGIKDEAVSLRKQGTAVPDIEKQLSLSRFRDKTSGSHVPLFPAQVKEQPSFTENLTQELVGGIGSIVNPSEVGFPGAETIGNISPIARSMLGSLLGVARTAYALPTATAKTLVGDPMRARGMDVRFPIGNPADISGRETSALEQYIPQAGAQQRTIGAADIAETGAGLGLSLLGGPITAMGQGVKYAGPAIRMLGRLLDPLSALQATSGRARAALETRSQAIKTATENLAKADEQLAQVEKFGHLTPAANEARILKEQAQGVLSQLIEAAPKAPAQVKVPSTVQSLIQPSEAVTARTEAAGGTFKTAKTEATKRLFAESSANYDNILQQYGSTALDNPGIQGISGAVSDIAEQLRGTTASRAVQGKLGRAVDIEGLAGYGEDALRQIQAQIAETGRVTVADAISMKQRLSAQNIRSKDLNVINANRHVMNAIDSALETVAGPAGEALTQANAFHRQVHGVVGPKSIAEKVFKMAPENIVDKVILPEGKAPNLTTIRKAKEVFLRSDHPEGWLDITDAALARFGQRIIDPTTGALDVQRFNRQFSAYESTFREALPTAQFETLKNFRDSVREFNQRSALFRAGQRVVKQGEQTVEKFEKAETQAIKAGGAAREARMLQKEAEKQYHSTIGPHRGGISEQFMSPYTMLAIAQVGQALQASFTGNWVGVGRQLAQGVVWYTLGNPAFLQKVINSPALSKSLEVAMTRGTPITSKLGNASRQIYEAIYQDAQEQQQ